jgi:hypothetical protein
MAYPAASWEDCASLLRLGTPGSSPADSLNLNLPLSAVVGNDRKPLRVNGFQLFEGSGWRKDVADDSHFVC